MIHLKIQKYLETKGWNKVSENHKFIEMKPPPVMCFREDYTLRIPLDQEAVDFERFLNMILDIIADIYEIKKDDLKIILEEQSVFSIRVADEDTQTGTISLVKFDDLLIKIKEILLNVASFVIKPELRIEKIADEAQKYLNLCKFVQTEKGSFVAKIQLPSEELIRTKSLFETEIKSQEITNKLAEILDFINKDVFLNESNTFDEDFIQKNKGKICLSLFEDIELLYKKTNAKNVDFSFLNMNQSAEINTKEITGDKRHKLTEFIEFAASQTDAEIEINVWGTIIALKSKNPDSTKNHITLTGLWENLPIAAEANLSSEDYKTAIDAHKYKDSIFIKGLARKNKNKFRFIRVDQFKKE